MWKVENGWIDAHDWLLFVANFAEKQRLYFFMEEIFSVKMSNISRYLSIFAVKLNG